MTTTTATKTGAFVNCHGVRLPEISVPLGEHDVVWVDEVAYYTHDFGGFVVGSREARSTDAGGNDVGRKVCVAPEPLDGMAAPLMRGAIRTEIRFSDPEIVGAGHRA